MPRVDATTSGRVSAFLRREICTTAHAAGANGAGGGDIGGLIAPPEMSAGDRVHFKVFAKGSSTPLVDILVCRKPMTGGGTAIGGGKKLDIHFTGNVDLALFKVVNTGLIMDGEPLAICATASL